jgi:hypothetical protein
MKRCDLLFRAGLALFFCAQLFLHIPQFGFPETILNLVMGFGVGIGLVGVAMRIAETRVKSKEKQQISNFSL